VPGLGTTFGRGGATTALPDLMNADVILIMGSNMAENHPVGFQWVMEAKERGTKVIHVDPRFSRTSAVADIWAPLRSGSDVVFLGGLVNYVLEHDKEFREYVVNYTNAPIIITEDFKDTEDLDGLFSGWNPERRMYDPQTWGYARCCPAPDGEEHFAHGGHAKESGRMTVPDLTSCERDDTLQHPQCVYQILKRHFVRYTPEIVERACGTPKSLFLKIAETFCSASGPDKTASICYAVGWTQHSNGVQIIRTAAILQLLLGNIGRPGGGIMALRGHASIQGSTDIPTLYDILPGYLPMPKLGFNSHDLAAYYSKHRDRTGWWWNIDKYVVSLLKAYYGDAATKENDWGFDWLPRVTGDHSHQGYFLEMMDGKVEGLFVIGQNPANAGPHARFERKALAKLKWLVVRDLVELETASFWYDSPEIGRDELRTEDIGTEVFFLPAAGHAEKDGCFTNTQRLVQWHQKAVNPPGDARGENWFMYHLGRRLKEKAKLDPRARNAGLTALAWDYKLEGEMQEPSAEEILQEINGYTVSDHKQVKGFTELKADGSTTCGCWIYSGIFPSAGQNVANSRNSRDFYGHGWAFSWPSDRRVIYNRASARPDGKPWSERKKLVWWDEADKQWTGLDVPDFSVTKPPDYKPPKGAEGDAALAGDRPFILHPDGLGWIWAPVGLADGPLPAHYEGLESPIRNPLYSQQTNPPAMAKKRPDNQYADSPDKRFPYVFATYRLTEHHTSGAMSRMLPHLAELQPEFFAEISPQLAAEKGIENGGWMTIIGMRGIIEARALVTLRIRPLVIDGKTVHQVGLPYHWGYRGLVKGDAANDLLSISEEPNVRIMESKGLLCNVVSGRRARGKNALEEMNQLIEGSSAGRMERNHGSERISD
jgi:formate dehydrogenase major subunit